jgi:hypothetical protein
MRQFLLFAVLLLGAISAHAQATAVTSGAPSAGAVPAAGTGDASPSIDYSQTSDDQILETDDGGEEGGAGDAGPGTGEEPFVQLDDEAEGAEEGEGEGEDEGEGSDEDEGAEAGEEGSEAAAAGKDKDDALPDPTEDPAEYKGIFKQHPALRQSFYREAAYREQFPTVAEARSYKELAPTVDALKVAVENADQLEQIDSRYLSGDPAQLAELIQGFHQTDANAFASLCRTLPGAIHKLDAGLYRSAIADPAVLGVLQYVKQLATDKGLGQGAPGQNLLNAAEVLSRTLFGKSLETVFQAGGQKTPREQELERQLSQANERQTVQERQAFESFYTATNATARTAMVKAVEKGLTDPKTGLLKGTAFLDPARKGAVQKMVGEIIGAIDRALKADRGFTKLVRAELLNKAGQRDQAHQERVAKLFASRAGKMLPGVAKKVIDEWTETVVGAAASRVSQARRAAARVDVTGGSGGGQGGGAPKQKVRPDQVDYSKTSDDDILNGRVRLRK